MAIYPRKLYTGFYLRHFFSYYLEPQSLWVADEKMSIPPDPYSEIVPWKTISFAKETFQEGLEKVKEAPKKTETDSPPLPFITLFFQWIYTVFSHLFS